MRWKQKRAKMRRNGESVCGECNAALERLIHIAQRHSGQSRRVASFLLSWWNAEQCGSFDPTEMWGVDRGVAIDMVTVFAYVALHGHYPDTLGYEQPFAALVRQWRPELCADEKPKSSQ